MQQQQMGMSPAEPPVDVMISTGLDGDLYELDWVLDTAEFKQAKTQKAKEKVLEQAFLAQKGNHIKKSASKISVKKGAILAGGTLLGTIIAGAMGYASFHAGAGLTGAKATFVGVFSYYMFLWGVMGLQPGGTGDLGLISLVKKFTEAYTVSSGMRKIGDAYTEVEVRFARKYSLMKTKNPRLLAELKTKMADMRNDTLEAFMYYKGYVKTATSVPVQRGVYTFDADKFKSYFKHYPNNLRRLLRNLAGRLTYFSQGDKERESINFPVYFIGVPGTGKTYAARGVAKVIGAPMAAVSLDGATIEDVVGVAASKEGEAKPGRLLSALSTMADVDNDTNYANGVLFIDEFDRLLNSTDPQSRALLSFMLKVLDPNSRKFFSPYLNTEIQLPTLIILAGNYEIKDEALANRFQQIEFGGYDVDTKLRITHEKILPEVARIYNYAVKDFSPADMQKIEALVKANTHDKGLRYIELGLILLIEEMRLSSLYGEIRVALKKSK
ncbi:MAG: ATP-binding protein [Zetaproteobacteria bacterium]|nr:ATP-binding protein [Zetaproteobacteria bacterium]